MSREKCLGCIFIYEGSKLVHTYLYMYLFPVIFCILQKKPYESSHFHYSKFVIFE